MYASIDHRGRITHVLSDVAQPHLYFETETVPDDLLDRYNIPRYKIENGRAVQRTQAEINSDIAAIPVLVPTPQEQTDALLADHEERLIYMELGV